MNKKHRRNLLKLARYLLSGDLEARFDMRFFSEYHASTRQQRKSRTCGSAGCALGHATYAVEKKLEGESYGDYSERLFGFWYNHAGNWLFGSRWNSKDNTPEAAGKRILWFLFRGLPDDLGSTEYQDLTPAEIMYGEGRPILFPVFR